MRQPNVVTTFVFAALTPCLVFAQDVGLRQTDVALARVERALEVGSVGEQTGAEAALRPLAADFLSRVERQRGDFERLAASDLPAKAAARLAQAQAAFESGHGRLATLLTQLALTPRVAGESAAERDAPAFRRDGAALAREAREILARLELAARPEPLSSELKLRAPSLRAPALPAEGTTPGASAAPDAASAAPIGAVPAELQNLADQLDGPLETYLWVRRNVAPEFYYGAAKGALETLHDGRGNDADTAALLVTLLRAKGIPARYVVGTADVPAESLRRLAGLGGSVEDALRLLQRAGIPGEPVIGPVGIASVKLSRVWVEAYVPYANYRGLDLDAQGKAWVPLDPAFKFFEPTGGLDVVAELGFDARAAWEAYQQQPRTVSPLEFVRAEVEALLAAQRPGTRYDDVLARRQVEGETLGILPNSLPYAATVSDRLFDLPASLAHDVRIVGDFDGTRLLDVTLPAARLIGERVTLSYLPFSEEDEAVVARFGSLYQTPPYLVEVRAVLSLDGIAVAQGDAPLGMGVKFKLRLDLRTPAGTESVTNTLQAGNLVALAVAGQTTTPPGTLPEDSAGRILSAIGQHYLARWNRADDEWARLLRVVPVRPTLSAAFVMSAVQIDYAGGDPLYPLTFDWKGVAVDADFRPLAAVGLEQRARESAFALLSGLEGARLEETVLAEDLQTPALSTVGVIQLAHAQTVEVLDLRRDNAEAIVPTLPFDATVKAELLDAALRGQLARVPASEVSSLAFSGVGYVLLDEESGEAAYQLQGGHSGGITAAAVNDWPARWSLPLRGYQVGASLCNRAVPAKIEMKSKDNDFGLVDQKLKDPLQVLVLDARGKPLKDACVTFVVMSGGGTLVPRIGGQDSVATVLTGPDGLASVELKLGRYTKDLPGYWCEDGRTCAPGQDEYTQVGINQVAVRAGAVIMADTFTHFGKPDPACTAGGSANCATLRLTTPAARGGAFNMQVGGLMGAKVLDRFDNPLSNVKVKFRFDPPLQESSLPSGWYRSRGLTNTAETPGLVLQPKDYLDCIRTNMNPGRHDCAGEAAQHVLPSGPFGVYAYAVIGDSTLTDYKYEVAKEGSSFDARATFSTAGWMCSSPDIHDCGLDWPQTLVVTTTRPRRVNAAGNFIEAYPVGTPGDLTISADYLEEDNTVIPASGSPESDSCGEIWRSRGNNVWKRKPLTNSQFNLSASTPGTGVPGSAPHVGSGDYRAQMTMAATPQENRARISSSHFPPVVHLLDCRGLSDRLDTARSPVATVDGVRKASRTPEPPGRAWRGSFEFPLWGAKVTIEKVEPQPIYVTESGRTTHPTLVRHKIEPAQWRTLLDPVQVYFKVAKSGGAALVEGTGNRGEFFTIPRDAPLEAGTYEARLEVRSTNLDDGKIEAQPKEVKTGKVNLVLDFNNDTKVDDADVAAVRGNPGATFYFWQADPNRAAKAAGLDAEKPLHILEEYATVRVVLPEAPAPDERLFLTLSGSGAQFRVAPHRGADAECGTKSYLCSMSAGQAQLQLLQTQEQQSSGGAIEVPGTRFAAGATDFVFRADEPMLDADGILSLDRWIDGQRVPVLERSVKIQSIQRYMSIVSARGPDQSVAPQVAPLGTWAELPPADKAPRVIVFLHGFNVTEFRALDAWFPIAFKRLYWSGVKLIEAQGEPSQRQHFVGFTWTGDRTSLWLAALAYPENEFSAQQTGVPLALYLKRDLRGREITMMAHSLGNMAVNSALTLVPSGTVRRYVMNDAAVAVEAFHPGPGRYLPTGLEENALGPYTRRYGRPDDHGSGGVPILFPRQDWIEQWESMLAQRFLPSTCGLALSDYARWEAELAAMLLVNPNLPTPQYDRRWRKFEPFDSAWTGVYRGNTGATLYNTYNPNDSVLRLTNPIVPSPWLAAQVLQKPHGLALGLTGDGRCIQYWGRLSDMGIVGESDLWLAASGTPGIAVPATPRARAALTRAWAERAYWFPTISGAAATADIPGAVNQSFVAYGADFHSYIGPDRPLSGVWKAYEYFAGVVR